MMQGFIPTKPWVVSLRLESYGFACQHLDDASHYERFLVVVCVWYLSAARCLETIWQYLGNLYNQPATLSMCCVGFWSGIMGTCLVLWPLTVDVILTSALR